MSTSEKRIAANRRNARKSIGPKTAARGRRASSRNAVKHGILAAGVLTANELPEDYEALKGQLRAALMPGNAIASELVEEIAAYLWRLTRSRRIEAGLLSNQVVDLERLHHLYGDVSCHGTDPATERRIALSSTSRTRPSRCWAVPSPRHRMI